MTDENCTQNGGKMPLPFEPALTLAEVDQLTQRQNHYQPTQAAAWLLLTKTPDQFRALVLSDPASSVELLACLADLNEYLCDSLEHGREALSRLRWAVNDVRQ